MCPSIRLFRKPKNWTPFRLIQAFIAAGCPAEALGFYPTDREGAAEILKSCGRALLFGDKSTTEQYANIPSIEIHGPGYSKIIIADDEIERWPEFIDLMGQSFQRFSTKIFTGYSFIPKKVIGSE
jgi:hypothetical protein